MNTKSSRPCFAVDIDNVLARAEREVQRIYWELTGRVWPRGRYGSAGGLDLGRFDPHIIEGIFTRFHEESIPVLPLLPGAKVVLNLLRHRYRILIVTARRPTSRPQTLAWLHAHQIYFDELYHAEDKTEIPESIALAVDDHPVHAQGYCELGARVFLMDQPWNREVSHALVTRVDGWDGLLHALHYGNITPKSSRLMEYVPPRDLLQSLIEESPRTAVEALPS